MLAGHVRVGCPAYTQANVDAAVTTYLVLLAAARFCADAAVSGPRWRRCRWSGGRRCCAATSPFPPPGSAGRTPGRSDAPAIAALYVHTGRPYPYLDLRVDEHPDPVAELRWVHGVARRELLPFVEAMPTRERPPGNFERLLDTGDH